MGWLSVICSAIAAYLYYSNDSIVLMIISILVGIICLWSYGVMHNFAISSRIEKIKNLRENAIHENDPEMLNRAMNLRPKLNLNAVPNWLTSLNLIFSILSFGLLILAFFKI